MKIKTGYPFCYGSHLLAMIIAAVVPGVGITVKAGDIIFVPCRWCVIGKDLNGNGKFDPGEDGAPAFTNPGGVTDTHGNPEPDTDNVLWRRHERASDNIWIPGAGISFRSAVTAAIRDDGHFPIIADPVISPGSQYGDILDAFTDPTELKTAVANCEAAWDALSKKYGTPLLGPIFLNIRHIVDSSGNPHPNGRNGQAFFTASGGSADVCHPDTVTATLSGYLQMADNQETVQGGARLIDFDPIENGLAHEMGHTLSLEHGDGIDNNGNGLFDGYPATATSPASGCDPTEPESGTKSVMTAFNPNPTITSLQRNRARLMAQRYTGITMDPPGGLVNGNVAGDQRVDTLHDVSEDWIDIVWVAMTHDQMAHTTTLSHKVFGAVPLTANAQYVAFVDLDNNPATGGDPSTLGFPTSFHGAELVTRIVAAKSGEFFNVVPTIWRFQGGTFVQVGDPQVSARIFESIEAESRKALFDVITIQMPDALHDPVGPQVRFQAIAQDLNTEELDQLPDGPSDASNPLYMVPPQFPICNVTPSPVPPGGAATVEVSGLLSNRIAKVIVGDEFVAMGTTDSNGAVRVTFAVPQNSRQGDRLITVGIMGVALTADCTVNVQGTPVHAPTILCPAAVTNECVSSVGTLVPLTAQVQDADGDAFTVVWNVDGAPVQTNNVPAGGPPSSAVITLNAVYPVGAHTVVITASDGTTLPASCTTSVTITDSMPPTVSCSVSIPAFWPPNHDLINVGLAATASDTCDPQPVVTVSVFGDEDDELPTGDGNHSPDAKDIGLGTLRLRAEREQNGDGRVYLIVVKATDASGNASTSCCTVVVPKDQAPRSIANVNAQAAAALAYCSGHNGSPPPGFVVIGDGPVLGPKQ